MLGFKGTFSSTHIMVRLFYHRHILMHNELVFMGRTRGHPMHRTWGHATHKMSIQCMDCPAWRHIGYWKCRRRGLTWASYQIRKTAVCTCAGNAGNVSPRRRFSRKLPVSDPGMHHGTCVTHVPWCMSGSLTCGCGENVPGIPGACASAILRIW